MVQVNPAGGILVRGLMMTAAVAESAVQVEGQVEAAPAAPAKSRKTKSATPIQVDHVARRFEPVVSTGTLKTPLKGLWTVDGQKGFYCFAGNLKPNVQPEVKDNQLVANYDSSGKMAPAVFERLQELEGVLVAQIQG